MALQPAPNEKIDREITSPFHLRLYYRANDFHSPSEFTTVPPPPSLQKQSLIIYTWSDATLSELTNLLTSALPDILPSPAAGTRIAFRLIFPDTRSIGREDARGRWLSKPVGSVVIGGDDADTDMDGTVRDGRGSGDRDVDETAQKDGNKDTDEGSKTTGPRVKMGHDAHMTLADARFVIGDYVSCAILRPLSDGSVAPVPPAERAGQYGADSRRLGPPRRPFGSVGGGGNGGGRRENGYGGSSYGIGYRGGGGGGRRGLDSGRAVPAGDWQRGERIPDGDRPRPF